MHYTLIQPFLLDRIIENEPLTAFIIVLTCRLVLHIHLVSVKQNLPSKMIFIIVKEVYITTYFQFTFQNEIQIVDIVSVKHNLPSKLKFIAVEWNSTVAEM